MSPATNGIRVVLAGVFDLTIPGGTGWTQNAKGTRWRFTDPTG